MGLTYFDGGSKVLGESGEFELGEERTRRVRVWFARDHGIQVKLYAGNIAIDGDLCLAIENLLAVVEQRFAIRLPFDFGGVLERVLHRSEALDEVDGAFVADA